MSIFIKNTGTTDTFSGLEIVTNSYISVDQIYLNQIVVSDPTMTHVGSGRLVVSSTNDGTTDMSVSEGLRALINTKSDIVHLADPFSDNESKYSFDGTGGISSIVSGVNNVDVLISEDRSISGAEVWTDSTNYGEYLSFQIIDIDNVLGGGANDIVDSFGDDWQIHPGGPTKAFPGYVGNIPAGLYVRMKVNVQSTSKFYYNLYLHKS